MKVTYYRDDDHEAIIFSDIVKVSVDPRDEEVVITNKDNEVKSMRELSYLVVDTETKSEFDKIEEKDSEIDWEYLMSLSDFEKLKYLLSLEIKVSDICIEVSVHSSKNNPYIPKDKIDLQFCGYAIYLNNDGTWFWDDTTGG